jgi:hypothetical protein
MREAVQASDGIALGALQTLVQRPPSRRQKVMSAEVRNDRTEMTMLLNIWVLNSNSTNFDKVATHNPE